MLGQQALNLCAHLRIEWFIHSAPHRDWNTNVYARKPATGKASIAIFDTELWITAVPFPQPTPFPPTRKPPQSGTRRLDRRKNICMEGRRSLVGQDCNLTSSRA